MRGLGRSHGFNYLPPSGLGHAPPEADVPAPARIPGKSIRPNDWLTDSSEWDACEREQDIRLSMLESNAVSTTKVFPEIATEPNSTDLPEAEKCFAFTNDMKFYPDTQELWDGQRRRQLLDPQSSILRTLVTSPNREYAWTDLVCCLLPETRNKAEYIQAAAVRRYVGQLRGELHSPESIQAIRAKGERPASYRFNHDFLRGAKVDAESAATNLTFANGMKFCPERRKLWNRQDVRKLSEIENSMLKMFVMEADRTIPWSDLACCLSKKTRTREPSIQYDAVTKCIGALRNKLNSLHAIETVRAAPGKAMHFRFDSGFLKG